MLCGEPQTKPKKRPTIKSKSCINEFQLTFVESEFSTVFDFKSRFSIKSNIGVGGQAKIKRAYDHEE